jgi:hypothetical protein
MKAKIERLTTLLAAISGEASSQQERRGRRKMSPTAIGRYQGGAKAAMGQGQSGERGCRAKQTA